MLLATGLRFVGHLRDWPRGETLETYLHATMRSFTEGDQTSRSPYKVRSLVMTPERERANEAIREWNARQFSL